MEEDEEGFEYPRIDESKCVRCYMCLTVCPFKLDRYDGYPISHHEYYEIESI